MKNKILILKLGGSLLTEKSDPFSIRETIINNSLNQVKESKQSLVLVHGGGSFGHPIAKKYAITNGIDLTINNQILGLSETHEAMNKLNSLIVKASIEKKLPVIPIQTSSIFIRKNRQIIVNSIEPIEIALDLQMIPILYGDIIFDMEGSFSIISGDTIILELCKNLRKYNVSKVIFAIEKDGLYLQTVIDGKSTTKLAANISFDELEYLKLATFDEKIDVTGGIKGKLKVIKEIGHCNIPVQIVNGLKKDYIMKALKSENVVSTNIKPKIQEESEDIQQRKLEHLTIPLEYDVQHSVNYFEDMKLIHCSFPEINFSEIDLSFKFFNKIISAPICIAAITGGHPLSRDINEILAKAAHEENIIMSVGSQRAGLMDSTTVQSFEIVRKVAPKIPIIGNIGIGQISNPNFNINDFKKCIEMIDADAMAIHFNALHELMQDKGDISYKHFRKKFKMIREAFSIPILAKEVGTGFSQDVASLLDQLGFDGFDIGGMGGTSFAAIESNRENYNNQKYTRNPAEIFREWGIPTPVSIEQVRKVSHKLIIATGGLRLGIDIAKAIALGADLGGFAYKFLTTASNDLKNHTIANTVNEIKTLKQELKSSLWLMNLRNLNELKGNKEKYVVFGNLYQWLSQKK